MEKFPPAYRTERILTLLVFLTCAGLVTLGWILEPDPRGIGTHSQLGFGECGLVISRGMPCPACGMTTAFAYGVRFNLIDGFRAQPAGLLAALLAYAAAVLSLIFAVVGKNPFVIFTKKRVYILLIIVIIIIAASWIYKIQTFQL
jgi:hypothetical protein